MIHNQYIPCWLLLVAFAKARRFFPLQNRGRHLGLDRKLENAPPARWSRQMGPAGIIHVCWGQGFK